MLRREFGLAMISAAGSVLCSHACHAWPTDRSARDSQGNPTYSDNEHGIFVSEGCRLLRAGSNGNEIAGLLLETSGNWMVDAAFTREVRAFTAPMFDLWPGVKFYDDSQTGANAWATPENLIGMPVGTIGFGVTLMADLFRKFSGTSAHSMGDHAACAIMAHEFAHIAQFRNSFPWQGGKLPELHADYMAGWYMGARALQVGAWQPVNIREAAQQMFDIGDFAFNDPGHHGTPAERFTAFTAGVQLTLAGQLQTARDAFVAGIRFLES